MSDIVERLLEPVDYLPREVRQEAAEEIGRLREQIAALQASSGYEASIAQVEVERLRGVNKLLCGDVRDMRSRIEDLEQQLLRALGERRALEPKP